MVSSTHAAWICSTPRKQTSGTLGGEHSRTEILELAEPLADPVPTAERLVHQPPLMIHAEVAHHSAGATVGLPAFHERWCRDRSEWSVGRSASAGSKSATQNGEERADDTLDVLPIGSERIDEIRLARTARNADDSLLGIYRVQFDDDFLTARDQHC